MPYIEWRDREAAQFKEYERQIGSEVANPRNRQRSIVLGLFLVNDQLTNWRYPKLQDLLPVAFHDRYYPEAFWYILRNAEDSLSRFIDSFSSSQSHAVRIADEVRAIYDINFNDEEILGVVTRKMPFQRYAEIRGIDGLREIPIVDLTAKGPEMPGAKYGPDRWDF